MRKIILLSVAMFVAVSSFATAATARSAVSDASAKVVRGVSHGHSLDDGSSVNLISATQYGPKAYIFARNNLPYSANLISYNDGGMVVYEVVLDFNSVRLHPQTEKNMLRKAIHALSNMCSLQERTANRLHNETMRGYDNPSNSNVMDAINHGRFEAASRELLCTQLLISSLKMRYNALNY